MISELELNSVKREFNNVADGVRYLLLNNKRARNEDRWLQLVYVRAVQGIDIRIPFENWEQMVDLESIRRTRQKIQEEALKLIMNPRTPEYIKENMTKLLPSPEVLRKRKVREEAIREFIKYWKPLGED